MSERRTTAVAVEIEHAASDTERRTSALALQVETNAIVIPRRVTLVALQVEYTPPPIPYDGHGRISSGAGGAGASAKGSFDRMRARGSREAGDGQRQQTALQTVISARSGGVLHALSPNARYTVGAYSWSALGGPDSVDIAVEAEADDIWEYLSCLRCPVDILTLDNEATPVWWGFIYAVEIRVGNLSVKVSLDTMANAVRSAYIESVPGSTRRGSRKTTAWAGDADSIAEYGRKEMTINSDATNANGAEADRDTALAMLALPVPQIEIVGDVVSQPTARLICKGWIETLKWRLYEQDAGKVEYSASGLKRQLFGWQTSGSEIAFDSASRRITDIDAGLELLSKDDRIIVSGSASNNGTFTVRSIGDRTSTQSYSASTIRFFDANEVVSESVVAALDDAVALQHDSLRVSTPASYSVTNEAGTVTYVSGTDYSLVLSSGEFTAFSGAAIADGQTVLISYWYYDSVTDEGVTADLDVWVDLAHAHLAESSPYSTVTVTNSAGSTTYTSGTDYDIDRDSGRIKAKSTGAISDGQALKVDYYYYSNARIRDSANGLAVFKNGDVIVVSGSTSNNDYYTVERVEADGSALTVAKNLTRELAGASVTIEAGSWVQVSEALTDEAPGASVTIKSEAERVAQQFETSASPAWTAANALIALMRLGSPADSVTVELRSDSAGAPGTLLDSGTFSGADLDASAMIDTVVTLSNTDEITAATPYWIVVKRSGSLTNVSAYVIGMDESTGYADGIARLYNGSTWIARTPDADTVFRVGGTWSIARQIEELIAEVGPFFDGVDIEDESSVYTSPWRAGDQSAHAELIALLSKGDGAGRRLLFTVTRDLRIKVYREPDDTDVAAYWLEPSGRLSRYYGGTAVDLFTCPVAVWLRFQDIVPPSANLYAIADPSHVFVEGARYDPRTGRWTPTFRNRPNPWDVGRIRAG